MSLLRFVSIYLAPLKWVPLAPQFFDAVLLLWHALFRRETVRLLEAVSRSVTGWPDVTVSVHRYGGTQFNLGRREIGHIHGNGIVDVLFDSKTRDALIAAGDAVPHHTWPASGWVSVPLRRPADASRALLCLRASYERVRDRNATGAVQ